MPWYYFLTPRLVYNYVFAGKRKRTGTMGRKRKRKR